VSSLWTPEGERPVRPSGGSGPGAPVPPPGRPPAGGSGPPDGGPGFPGAGGAVDEAAAAAEIEALRRQVLSVPAAIVVANHAYGLFELAAIHLSEQPPNLGEAALAVDALGALVEGLGGRLGEAEDSLKEALSQIRLAFVQITSATEATADPDAPAEGTFSGGETDGPGGDAVGGEEPGGETRDGEGVPGVS
jgi:hypothetical protein